MIQEKNLNKEQIEAVNFVNGNLLIVASAGTGKTTTIVERYANLIKNHNYKPNEILMTTFTNKAAKDMIKKIFERTGTNPPYVGTMHSLFLRILRENALSIFPSKYFTIIDDPDKKLIIKKILSENKIDSKSDSIRYFIAWISKFKNRAVFAENLDSEMSLDDVKEEGIIEDLLDDEIIRIDPRLRKSVNKVYKKYEEELRKNNLIDLDDILLFTLRLFENNNDIKERYFKQFKAIMVDEAQDLNVAQIKILTQLQNNNLCLIGDDCQNIYEWRGSSNDLVFKFNENQNKITLTDNYRSGKKIIESVNKIIDSMSFKIDKQLNCTKDYKDELNINSFFNFYEELSFIVEKIKELLKKGISKEEIAVLFRTNRIGKSIERELRKNKIPCHLSKSKDFFEREEIKDILSFLKLKINPYSKTDFERLMVLLDGIGKIKIQKFEELAINRRCSYIDVLNYCNEFKINPATVKELNKLKSVIINNKNPFTSFLKDFGYINYIKSKYNYDQDRLKDKLENIGVLEDLFDKEKNTIEEIKNFLDSLIELEKKEKTRDKITLSTIHSAKGLEWECVFLASCNERTLPFYIKELTKSKMDSELRLFYVALSRAKKSLFISHYEESDWRTEIERSQFLDIIN